jgi:hypothetical protein
MPSCDHTGTPAGFEGFLHFTSSIMSGSTSLMSLRICASIALRQSPGLLAVPVLVGFFMMSSLSLRTMCLKKLGDVTPPVSGSS